MKVLKIYDESNAKLPLGYLIYYEKSDSYSLEIRDDLKVEDFPIFLASFAKRKHFTIGPEWSRRWVEQRIVPSDRQNLGAILKENGLKEYDTFKLLNAGCGRCAQDDCAVTQVRQDDLPLWLAERLNHRIDFAVTLKSGDVLIIFYDGLVRKTRINDIVSEDSRFQFLIRKSALNATVLPGGAGLTWGEGPSITSEKLHEIGELVPLSGEDLRLFADTYVVDTSDVMRELGCTRQYVSQLVREGKLYPIRKDGSTRFYSRSELNRLAD